jgi:hypothetical protein
VEERCELIRVAGAVCSALDEPFLQQDHVLDEVFKWIAPCSLPNRYSFQHVHQDAIRFRINSKGGITL